MTRFALALSLAAALAPAQEPRPAAAPAQRPVIKHDATTFLVEAGSVPFRELVDAAGRFLGRNILMQERELVGGAGEPFVLQLPLALDKNGCEDTLCDLLHSRGLLLAARDPEKGLWEVFSTQGPRVREVMAAAPMRTPEAVLARPYLKQMVITVVTLERVNGTVATNALRPMLALGPSGVSLASLGKQQLSLSGWQHEVARAVQLLQEMDQPPPGAVPAAPDQAQQIAALEQQVRELSDKVAALEQALAKKGR